MEPIHFGPPCSFRVDCLLRLTLGLDLFPELNVFIYSWGMVEMGTGWSGWSVCLTIWSVYLPLHHKVQKVSSGTGSPGWSRKKGRKTVVVVFT